MHMDKMEGRHLNPRQGMAGRGTGFKTIQLFKEQTLGVGSYGKVCKAKCDDLICAAKILHPTLFDPNVRHQRREHAGRLPIQRFEQECEFMSAMRHPNIVQYLGLDQDPDTGLPVLLMELMDDSLTHYLESSPQPIPFHIQVNVCLDIALALSFLHNNHLVHRDLSSNNILLRMGNVSAKVTDFGMTKLGDLSPHLTYTMCPGTDVYMPPEAVQDRPVYTEKIDCFSFGVITIQILTRRFPKPGDRQQRVESNHPGLPRGTLMVCVPERDRRRNDISEVDPNHSLLPIALDCLSDRDSERPTAQQLCKRVAVLKYSSMYSESERKQVSTQQVQGLQQEEIQQLRQQLQQGISENDQRIAHAYQIIEHKNQAIAERGIENQQLKQQLDQAMIKEREKDKAIMHNYQIIQQKDKMIAEREQEIEQLRQRLHQADQNIAYDYQLIQQRDQTIAEREREIQQLRQQLQQAALQDKIVMERERKVGDINHQLETNEKAGGKLGNLAAKPEHKPVINQKGQLQTQHPGTGSKAEPFADLKLRWKEGQKTLRGMKRASDATVSTNDNVVYVLPYSNHDTTVHKFEIATNIWSNLKSFPYKNSSLVVIKDLPTVVGYYGLSDYSNKLFSFTGEGNDGKWTQEFPAMPTKRANTSVLVVGENLFVVGGENSQGPLTVVEVMNIETRQWSPVTPLLEPLVSASVTVCSNSVYVLGGKSKTSQPNKSVYTCSLSALLPKSLGVHLETLSSENQPSMWRKVADLPVSDSTCVSLHGQLIAIGGTDSSNKSTKAVHMYNQTTNSWKVISHMINDRHSCFAAVLPNNQLMVVGGTTSHRQTNSVEFGNVE